MDQPTYDWVETVVQRPGRAPRIVLEYGGRDINGSVRPIFAGTHYTSIDIRPGPGVDVVADALEFVPGRAPDTIVCCEVLEHTPVWPDILHAAARSLQQYGRLVLTCACAPRAPHSATDGGPLVQDEYYANVEPLDLDVALQHAGFSQREYCLDGLLGYLRVVARLP
jgi:hypothetical protein